MPDRQFLALVLVALALVACTVESLQRLGASTRLGLYGNTGTSEMDVRSNDELVFDENSVGAILSFDLMPAFGVAEQERISRMQAADIARALAIPQPGPVIFGKSDAPTVGGDSPAVPTTTESDDDAPWYATPEAMGLVTAALTALGVWQRKHVVTAAQYVTRHKKRQPRNPAGA